MVVERYTELRDMNRINGKRPVMREIDLSKVVINRTRNHRDETEAYELANPDMQDLMNSIKAQGMIPGYEPTVHDEGDGVTDALIGHRRLTACKHLGLKTVMCKVLSGLSEEEKLMVIFNPDEVPPGPIGEYKQVKALISIGMSRKAIAEKLNWKTGKSRKLDTNQVQYYAELLSLPQEIQDEWMNQNRREKKATMPDLTSSVVRQLYAASKKDAALFQETEGLEGSVTSDGPAYREEVAVLKKTGKTIKAGKERNSASQSVLEGYASTVKNNLFKQWILGISGVKGINFGPMLEKIDEACNLVYPNPKPSEPPKEVEDLFKEENGTGEPATGEPATGEPATGEPATGEPAEVISEGITTPIKVERETVKNRFAKRRK